MSTISDILKDLSERAMVRMSSSDLTALKSASRTAARLQIENLSSLATVLGTMAADDKTGALEDPEKLADVFWLVSEAASTVTGLLDVANRAEIREYLNKEAAAAAWSEIRPGMRPN